MILWSGLHKMHECKWMRFTAGYKWLCVLCLKQSLNISCTIHSAFIHCHILYWTDVLICNFVRTILWAIALFGGGFRWLNTLWLETFPIPLSCFSSFLPFLYSLSFYFVSATFSTLPCFISRFSFPSALIYRFTFSCGYIYFFCVLSTQSKWITVEKNQWSNYPNKS